MLEVEVSVIEKLLGEAEPFSVHAKVRLSEFASAPLAVRLMLPVVPTVVPVDAGACDEHVGGLFLTTVQVYEVELDPLLAVATSTLLPVLRAPELMVLDVDAPPAIADPFNVQVTAQDPSLGETVKNVSVEAESATRTLLELGLVDKIEQAGKT